MIDTAKGTVVVRWVAVDCFEIPTIELRHDRFDSSRLRDRPFDDIVVPANCFCEVDSGGLAVTWMVVAVTVAILTIPVATIVVVRHDDPCGCFDTLTDSYHFYNCDFDDDTTGS